MISGFLMSISLYLPASAAAALSAEIVSWQVIGLDSNAPATSPPELFLVQAQVTNTGDAPATNVTSSLAMSAPDCGGVACITLVSSAIYTIGTLDPGETRDAFWTVRIAKTAAAFDTTTPITVTAQADGLAPVTATQVSHDPPPCGSDPTGASVLFVERLISQSRNNVLSYSVSPGVQLPDGTWEVVQGSDFTVTVLAETATEYSEVSVPAVVDPSGAITPQSVSFAYTLGTAADDDIYTLDAGGEVTAQYNYRAASLGEVRLSQLIYDCSGNSFHYNSDYLVDFITIRVVPQMVNGQPDPQPNVTLTKSSSPSGTVDPGEKVTFTISYANSGPGPATGFVISDQIDPNLTNIQPGPGGAYDPSTRTITWMIGTIDSQSSGSVSFTAFMDDFAGGKTIRNVAVADADQFDPLSSGEVLLTIPETTPVTGVPAGLLAILGWSLIGTGEVLNRKRIRI